MKLEEKSLFGTAKHFKVKVKKAKENPIKFILSVLSYALFIFLLLVGALLLVYVINIKIKEAKGDMTPPTYNAYVVLTGSMVPEILVNDVVITKKRDVSKLERGDIITFVSTDPRFSGLIITHRIKNIYVDATTGEYSFETQGDANPSPDFTLTKGSKVLGEVILKIPKLGYIQQFLATKGGWIIVILIPCLAVLSYDILKLIKILTKRKNSKTLLVK